MKNYLFPLLLVMCILVETLSYTYLAQTSLYYSTSILYLISGLGVCFLPFLNTEWIDKSVIGRNRRSAVITIFVFAVLLTILILPMASYFKNTPIEFRWADMLPRIRIYIERLFTGRYVYDDVKEIWGGNLPPYLPATWLPFIPSVLIGYDMRWTVLCAFLTALFLVLLLLRAQTYKVGIVSVLLLLTSLFLLINFHAYHQKELWTMTYEGLIVLYYILLCWGIIKWSPYLIGIGIALCVLSRFSLIFWVPFFLLFLWRKESFRFLLKTISVLGAIILFSFILPFVVGHCGAFLGIISQYEVVSKQFWTINYIDQHLYSEVGMYKFFLSTQVPLLRDVQLFLSVIAPPLFILYYTKYIGESRVGKIIIGLCSLKISLLFFYNFIDMPLHYLFIVPTMISYTIGFYYLSLNHEIKYEQYN